jgi:hypothetical protein
MLIPIGNDFVNPDHITRVYNFANGKVGTVVELYHPDCFVEVHGLTANETVALIEGEVLAKKAEEKNARTNPE